MTSYESEIPRQTVELDGHHLSFCVPNEITRWRIDNFVPAEPVTIAWILGFEPNECFVDVGAGIGVFSIAAAVCRQARVFAFEPQAQNYALLCRNIEDNDLGSAVVAWPAAISDETTFGELHVMVSGAGNAHHSYGEAVNFNLHPQTFPSRQGSISTTLDALVVPGVIPSPNHLKIDVDGFEHRVIEGAEQTLKSPELKSVLVEMNPRLVEHDNIFGALGELGFDHDPELTERSRRTEGIHEGMAEVVFRR